MSSSRLLLYVDRHFTSPFAMSVFVALHEKALPFEIATVDLDTRANHDPAYATTSLTHRVPTLVHDDFALSESSAIAEYLDDVFPDSPLYPHDPRSHARARQVQAWLRSDLMALRQERSTEVVFCGMRGEPLSDESRTACDKLFAAAHALLPAGAQHLFGQWTIADVDLALMLNRLVLHGDPVPARLADYARHQWQRPSVQLWVEKARSAL
jgi:glutathione S-transferase